MSRSYLRVYPDSSRTGLTGNVAGGTPYQVLARGLTSKEFQWVSPSGMTDVRLLGAATDGVTDSTTKLQTAITAAGANAVLLFAPGTVWVVSSSITPVSGQTWIGYGSTFKSSATLGSFSPCILVDGKTQVTFEGFVVDGQKALYAPVTEQRHGISIVGGSSVIHLRDLYLHDNKGDGLYIGAGDGLTFVDRLVAENVWCDLNHRQGMSISGLRSGNFLACWFTNTSGTAPQAGVDIEPNNNTVTVRDIIFEGGGAYGNAGNGFQWFMPSSSSVQGNVTVRDFTARNNTGDGFSMSQGNDFRIIGCPSYSNGNRGVVIVDNCRGVSIVDCDIYLNGLQGIYVLAQSGTKTMAALQICRNQIYDNSATAANTVDAVRIDWVGGAAAGCTGVIITENFLGNRNTANQRYALTTDGTTKFLDLVLSNNYMKGNATGVSVLNDDTATRRVRGNAGLVDN